MSDCQCPRCQDREVILAARTAAQRHLADRLRPIHRLFTAAQDVLDVGDCFGYDSEPAREMLGLLREAVAEAQRAGAVRK